MVFFLHHHVQINLRSQFGTSSLYIHFHLVENKNHEALVEGLKNFIKKIPEFSKEKIRENCINSYSEKVIIEKIKNVYKEVLKN